MGNRCNPHIAGKNVQIDLGHAVGAAVQRRDAVADDADHQRCRRPRRRHPDRNVAGAEQATRPLPVPRRRAVRTTCTTGCPTTAPTACTTRRGSGSRTAARATAREGSHGCVHFPGAAIAWMYGWIRVGTLVHIYGDELCAPSRSPSPAAGTRPAGSLSPSRPHRPGRRRDHAAAHRARSASTRSSTSSSSCRRTGRSTATSARTPAPTASRWMPTAIQRCAIPNPRPAQCLAPYHDTSARSTSADRTVRGRTRRTSTAARWTASSPQSESAPQRLRQHPGVQERHRQRRHGLPHRCRAAELLDVREELRARGPHVRVRRVVERRRAPVHGVGVVGDRARPVR